MSCDIEQENSFENEIDDFSPDKDDLNGDVNEVFSCRYHAEHWSLLAEDAYILNVDTNCDSSKCLASLSNNKVKILSPTLSTLSTLSAHDKAVTQCAFSKTDSNLLFTSSIDCTIKLWDLRSPDKPSLVFKDTSDTDKHVGPPINGEKPVLCFDTSADDRLLCGGTEQVGQGSFLLFWDTRSSELKGGYWDSHEDDVTFLKFHPVEQDMLASGSTDGLVNVFDIREEKEDDAITTCHNTEDSVSRLHWYTKNDKPRYLAILTHTEGIQLWDTDHYQPYQTFDRSDIAHGIRRSQPDHTYIVGAHQQLDQDQGLALIAGSSYSPDPCLRLASVRNKKLKPTANLKSPDGSIANKNSMVRDSAQFNDLTTFITGSEGGVVMLWKPGVSKSETVHSSHHTFKFKNKTKTRDKPY